MKFLAIVAVLTFACAVECGEADKTLIKALAKPCQTKVNASDKDLDDLLSGVAPTTPEGKCLAACMAKQYGMITSENKLNKDVFVAALTMKDASLKDAAGEIADACADVTDDDECAAGEAIWECVAKESKDREVDLKKSMS